MKIGFYFECSTRSGGAYQYALNMLEVLKSIPEHEYVVFNISPDFPYHLFKLQNWSVIDLGSIAKKEKEVAVTATENIARNTTWKRRLNLFVLETLRKFHLYRIEILLTSRNARRRAHKFSGHGIDIMFYHGPSELSFLTDIPGIVPIHDIEHRLHRGEFPELSEKGQYAKREYLFTNISKKALKILVDSGASKTEVAREYRTDPEKKEVVPFVPPSYLKKNLPKEHVQSVQQKFSLPEKFFYYPAQFWPHKNHMNLVKAAVLLRDKGVRVNLVFTGGTQDLWGEYARVMEYVRSHGIEDQVKFLGFVNANEISALYLLAEAMVMPVLMGPTYIPVYEAWHMECPVIYSNLPVPREQAGNAALLIDPHDPRDIAEKLHTVWGNEALRADLVQKGTARLAEWTWNDFRTSIQRIINDTKDTVSKRGGPRNPQ